MNKMKLMLIPLLLLLCSVVVVSTASLATVNAPIMWRLELEEVTPDIDWITDTLALQVFEQDGDVYDGEDDIGDITMQVRFLLDTDRLQGHANVKFNMTIGEDELTGVMNGKIWYEDPNLEHQLIKGRFVANGAYHVHGTVTNLATPVENNILLQGVRH